jgi:hypothetical protein
MITSEKISRTIMLKFRFTKDSHILIDRLNKYVEEAAFCVYSARLNGDLDWVSQLSPSTNNILIGIKLTFLI